MSQGKRPDKETSGRPYVRYRVFADVDDRGIGFSIQQALRTFLDNHGYQTTISVTGRSSDRFEAVINIFDNGHYDFNATALLEHVRNSGRMPTSRTHQPTINITPLPCDFNEIEQIPEQLSDLQWQGVVNSLNQRLMSQEEEYTTNLGSKELTIKGLTDALDERQKVIGAKDAELKRLKKVVDEGVQVIYPDAISALVNGYLNGFDEILFDLSTDLASLVDSDNLEMLKVARPKDYIAYVNRRFGTSFELIEDITNWVKSVRGCSSWRERPGVESLLKARDQIGAEERAISEMIQREGISPEFIETLKGFSSARRSQFPDLERQLYDLEHGFEGDVKVAEALSSNRLYESYQTLVSVTNNAYRRKKEGKFFPILAKLDRDYEGATVLFLSLDRNSRFEEHLISKLSSLALNFNFDTRENTKRSGENFVSFSFAPRGSSSMTPRAFFMSFDRAEDADGRNGRDFFNDDLTSFLGVEIYPITLVGKQRVSITT